MTMINDCFLFVFFAECYGNQVQTGHSGAPQGEKETETVSWTSSGQIKRKTIQQMIPNGVIIFIVWKEEHWHSNNTLGFFALACDMFSQNSRKVRSIHTAVYG